MNWLKTSSIVIIVLCLFIGGIIFDIVVIKKFTNTINNSNGDSSDSLTISQNIEAYKVATPTSFHVPIHIVSTQKLRDLTTLDSNQRGQIMQTFDTIIATIKENEAICKGGEYFLGITQYWKNNQMQNGYDANLRITCKFTVSQKDSYFTFISKILTITDNNEFLETSIAQLQPILLKEEQKRYETEMQDSILIQAQELSKLYSDKLKLKCDIARLTFDRRSTQPILYKANVASIRDNVSSMSTHLPVIQDEELTMQATLQLRCQ